MDDATQAPVTDPRDAAVFLEREMRDGFLHPGFVAPGTRGHEALVAVLSAVGGLAAVWDAGFDAGYDRVLVERASKPGAPDLRRNPYREGAE